MSTFEKFVHEAKASSSSNESSTPGRIGRDDLAGELFSSSNISAAVSSVLTKAALFSDTRSKQAELSNHVAKLATSDELVAELSTTLGDPKPGETENEFVARARMAFRGIMKRKLTKL